MKVSKRKLTIGICALMMVFGFIVTHAFGQEDQDSLDKARAVQLKDEIQSNVEEYNKLAPQRERNQSRCSLAEAQAKQMTALNAANNAKRSELQFLEAKLRPQPPVK